MVHLKYGEHYVIIKGRIHKLEIPMRVLYPLPRTRNWERVIHKRGRFYRFRTFEEILYPKPEVKVVKVVEKVVEKVKEITALWVWRHVASAAKYCGNKHRKIEVWTFTYDDIDLSAELERIIHDFASDECSETFITDAKLIVRSGMRDVYNYSKERISTVEALLYEYKNCIWPKYDYEEIEF